MACAVGLDETNEILIAGGKIDGFGYYFLNFISTS
jgi:hypothetical protein